MSRLCIILAAAALLTVSFCAADEGSGEEVVTRPRPDELEGSGEEVTRSRPAEVTTQSFKTKTTKCKCYVVASGSGKKAYREELEELIGDEADTVKMKYADSQTGCQEVNERCASRCAALSSKFLSAGVFSLIPEENYKDTLGDIICDEMETTRKISNIRIVGYTQCNKNKGARYSRVMTIADSLCCRKRGKKYTASRCASSDPFGY